MQEILSVAVLSKVIFGFKAAGKLKSIRPKLKKAIVFFFFFKCRYTLKWFKLLDGIINEDSRNEKFVHRIGV